MYYRLMMAALSTHSNRMYIVTSTCYNNTNDNNNNSLDCAQSSAAVSVAAVAAVTAVAVEETGSTLH
jgi:hypothetical protein